jgi:hypothetical protein
MTQQLNRKRRLVQRMFSTSHHSHTSDVDDDNNDNNKHDKILLPITTATTTAAAATAITTPARRQKPMMMMMMNMMIDSGLRDTTSDDSDWLYCCVEIPKDSNDCGETKSWLPPPSQQRHGRKQTKQQQQQQQRQPMILLLQRYSRIASWICVFDCTILPIVTFLMPLLSGGLKSSNNNNSSSSIILEFIHSIGDYSVIYFLLPVGTVSVTLQYYTSHQQLWIFGMGVIGLVFVTIANFYNLPIVGHIDIFHIFHGGIYHRLLNIFGCTCLVGSNHIARIYHQRRYNNNSGNNNEYDDTACCVLHQYYDSKNNKKKTKHYHKPYALRLHV